jgi:hypothetical protein
LFCNTQFVFHRGRHAFHLHAIAQCGIEGFDHFSLCTHCVLRLSVYLESLNFGYKKTASEAAGARMPKADMR